MFTFTYTYAHNSLPVEQFLICMGIGLAIGAIIVFLISRKA